jgi:hypothetical protein
MATRTTELKAALPADFSGEPADAMRWIKAMKAYFVLNASMYPTDDEQVITTLNKMSKGREVSFSDMWYDRMLNTSLSASDKTFAKFRANFESTFFPFDTQATSRYELFKLVQSRSSAPMESTRTDSRNISQITKTSCPRLRSRTNELFVTNSRSDSTTRLPQ